MLHKKYQTELPHVWITSQMSVQIRGLCESKKISIAQYLRAALRTRLAMDIPDYQEEVDREFS